MKRALFATLAMMTMAAAPAFAQQNRRRASRDRTEMTGPVHGPRATVRAARALFALSSVVFLIAGCVSQPNDAAAVAAAMKQKMTLPVQVDGDTRLDDVRATSKMELGYFLTLVNQTRAEFDAKPIASEMERTIREGACKNPDYRKLLSAGLSLRMTYQTRDDVAVIRIVIAPKDCGD